jgi:DnaJ like chaperone protein
MSWFGKTIGAALGMAIAGPWGSLIGAVLGHQLDHGSAESRTGGGPRAQQRFFATTFEVMGHVAKVDGRVSEEEIEIARRIMQAMHLGPDQMQQAIGYFSEGKDADYPLEQRLAELAGSIGRRRELARAFVEIQLQAAVGAGEIAPSKRELLWIIAQAFGFDRSELAGIESRLRAERQSPRAGQRQLDLGEAYRTLGVAAGASDKDVKTAYRRLMNQHHPDKLVSKGLPEAMIAVAEERTQQIRAAYERIRTERGFK